MSCRSSSHSHIRARAYDTRRHIAGYPWPRRRGIIDSSAITESQWGNRGSSPGVIKSDADGREIVRRCLSCQVTYAKSLNIGGARRDRTADLVNAIHALSQLSYGPLFGMGSETPDTTVSAAPDPGPWLRPGDFSVQEKCELKAGSRRALGDSSKLKSPRLACRRCPTRRLHLPLLPRGKCRRRRQPESRARRRQGRRSPRPPQPRRRLLPPRPLRG